MKNFSSVPYQRMASILFYEIDPNYSNNKEQISPGTNGTLHQDYTTDVSSIRQNDYNKKRKYGERNKTPTNNDVPNRDDLDINDNIDDEMATDETHLETEQNSDASSESDSSDSLFTCPNIERNNSAKKSKWGKNILTFGSMRAKARPRRSASERYSNVTQRKFG
jgi:hypothetical protein